LVELENKSVAVSTTGELKSAMALPEKVSQLWSD